MNEFCDKEIQPLLDSRNQLEGFIEHAVTCKSCAARYDEIGNNCFGIEEVVSSFDVEAFYLSYSIHCEKCRKTKECLEESGVAGLRTMTLTNAFQASTGIPDFYRPLLIGNRFFLDEKIGRGGFGSVFAGYDSRFKSNVAVKLTRSRFGMAAALSNEEANSLMSLHHQGIVNVFDYGQTDICDTSFNFISMEKFEHQDLLKYCIDKDLSVNETLSLFHDICEALSYAHRHRVFHRDIKPSNILVQVEENKTSPRIIDFGVAVQGDRITSSDIAGTPGFMNLEKLDRDPLTTTHEDLIYDDIYSLGLVLFQCLAKRRRLPEPDVANSNGNWIEFQKNRIAFIADTIKNPQTGFPDKDLHSIVAKAIGPSKESYATIEDLADDIKRYQEHFPVKARKNTFTVQLKKYWQRQPLQAMLGVSFILLLTLSSIVGWVLNSRLASSKEKVVRNFNDSMELLEFIDEKAGVDLRSRPGTSDVRTDMLRKIQQFYANYLESGDVNREEYLNKKQELGLRYSEIGDPENAINIYQQLISELNPQYPKENQRKSRILFNLASVQMSLRRFDEATSSIQSSRKIMAQVVGLDAKNLETKIEFANSANLKALILEAQRKPNQAIEEMTKGINELKLIAAENPKNNLVRQRLIRLMLNLDNRLTAPAERKKNH